MGDIRRHNVYHELRRSGFLEKTWPGTDCLRHDTGAPPHDIRAAVESSRVWHIPCTFLRNRRTTAKRTLFTLVIRLFSIFLYLSFPQATNIMSSSNSISEFTSWRQSVLNVLVTSTLIAIQRLAMTQFRNWWIQTIEDATLMLTSDIRNIFVKKYDVKKLLQTAY